MANPYDDDDEAKDEILKQLGGEADDYAASDLDKAGKTAGVTIEISVKPNAKVAEAEEQGERGGADEPDGEHDMIAHVLGLCKGGCPE